MEIPKTVQVVQIQCGFKIKSALTFSKLAQLWDSAESAESAGILKKVFSTAIQSRTPALSRRSATLKRPCGDGGLANPESINHHVGMLNQVLEPLIVVDKYILEFPVEQFVMGWREINLAWISIHSKKAVEDMGRDKALLNPIGTGVFAMSEWIADNKFVGEANVDYWGTVPSFDNLIVLEVPEASTRVAMIKTGAAGIIDGVGFSFAKGLTEAGITPTSANKGGQSQVISFAGNYWQKKHHETGEPVSLAQGSNRMTTILGSVIPTTRSEWRAPSRCDRR